MSDGDLDAFLASGRSAQRTPNRCRTCLEYEHLAPHIQEFMRRKAAGETHLPTQTRVGQKSLLTFLQGQGYTLSESALVRHVTNCLGLDHRTGRPL